MFYADEEGKQLLVDDPEARREVIAAFGADSYHDDGRLNRAFLADQVFSDDDKLERLNRIVHPRVLARFEKVAEKAEREHVPLMVKEAALIFESGGEALLDAVAVVDAPREERIARVVARDDAEPADVKARMRHQMEPAELRRRADVVIENDGDLPQLRKQVEALYEDMSTKP